MHKHQNIEKNKITFVSLNRKIILVDVLLLVGFFVSQIFVMSILGTKTQEIDFIRNDKEKIRLQNEILISEINKAKSLATTTEVKEEYDLTQKSVEILEDKNTSEVALND
jgi:hypothetical protein